MCTNVALNPIHFLSFSSSSSSSSSLLVLICITVANKKKIKQIHMTFRQRRWPMSVHLVYPTGKNNIWKEIRIQTKKPIQMMNQIYWEGIMWMYLIAVRVEKIASSSFFHHHFTVSAAVEWRIISQLQSVLLRLAPPSLILGKRS